MNFGRMMTRLRPRRAAATEPALGVIYDVGMNNGDDCAYYLKKGRPVVAVEANPVLCDIAASRFAAEIESGALTILNLGIADAPGTATFYVHRTNSVLSTFVPPGERIGYTATLPPAEFDPITVQVRCLSAIVAFFGPAHYIKIDIEGYDDRCLADLHRAGIRPPFLSAEAHEIDTFCHLVAMGYGEFQLAAGATVAQDYRAHPIEGTNGSRTPHDFPPHSAGPFGVDLPGPWLDKNAILARWLARDEAGPGGWFDLHARLPPSSRG
jgi:FkbM family methyltransferase